MTMKLDSKEILNIYVKYGVKFVNLNVNLLNRYMRHLIVIRGLDPNSEPGTHFKKLLNKAFDYIEGKDYDDDYDFSWAYRKYANVKDKLEQGKFDLNLKKFNQITDISNLDDVPADNYALTDEEITNKLDNLDNVLEKSLEILDKSRNRKNKS